MSYDLRQPRQLVSQEDAAIVQGANVPRSTFINEFSILTTFDQGKLIPFIVEEVMPGDHLRYNMTAYVRMATPTFPVFSNLRVDTHWFFVPCRLVWSNFERFMGEQPDPGSSTAFTVPTLSLSTTELTVGSIYDYMGIPVVGQVTGGQSIAVNVLPLRAYNLIYNDWFRDQNLINSLTVQTGDSGDFASSYAIRNRAKMHDYFTSALPWPQKFAAQSVPMSGSAPVTGIGTTSTTFTATSPTITETVGTPAAYAFYQYASTASIIAVKGNQAAGGRPQIFADLGAATGTFTINALRQAWLIQAMYERDARGGTRYAESVLVQYGVRSDDARLQRPEYIGGGSSPLVITPIANQSATNLGTIGGAGTATGGHQASYAATEHGYILGIVSVRSELIYSQGLDRLWTRSVRTDFAVPILSDLGEQAILRQELYCTGVDADDTTIFGYQERYHEYRTRVSIATGLFRPRATGNIAQWHLGDNFLTPPVLGQTFIEDQAPMSRVLAAGTGANGMQFLADFLIQRAATRPLPKYGTPASLGRF